MEARGSVEREEMREWKTRHARDKKKKKGDVGIEKEKEKEEGEKSADFFSTIYDFFNPVPVAVVPGVPANPLSCRHVLFLLLLYLRLLSLARNACHCITTRSTA